MSIFTRFQIGVFTATLLAIFSQLSFAAGEDGVVRLKSSYSFSKTLERLKHEIQDKGILLFDEIDQAKLAAGAGIALHPSTLLVFGNPPLGTQFMTSSPNSGLDWPVRLLVIQEPNGEVWTVHTDFSWIAARHGITDRKAQFDMANNVVGSILSSVNAK